MKAAKWRDLSDDELTQKARELSEEIFNLRFQLSMGVAKNPARVNQVRRDVARAKTVLRERGLPSDGVSARAVATPSGEPVAGDRPRSRGKRTPATRRSRATTGRGTGRKAGGAKTSAKRSPRARAR